MIAVRELDERVVTAGQLRPEDMRTAAEMGFKVVINNRPDGEAWFGQPTARAVNDAAAAVGLKSHYLPISLKTVGAEEVRRFRTLVIDADGPVLTFCTSGFRCALMWALSEAAFSGASVDDVMRRASVAGHDLSKSRPLIERILIDFKTSR